MPKQVSIVVPAYNADKFIRETLESLVRQTYVNKEIIVIDDGSLDQTSTVAKEFSNRGVRVVTQVNQGQAKSLNNGWTMSRGDYIGYLSADDILYPDAIARLVDVLEKNSSAVLVYPDYDLIDANSKKIREQITPDFDYRQMVTRSVCAPGPGALFRRKIFDEVGGWDPSLRQIPDFDFWLRCGNLGAFIHLHEVLAGFRIHEESQTYMSASFEKSEEPVRVLQKYFSSPLLSDEAKAWRREAIAYSHVLSARLHVRAGRWSPFSNHLRLAFRSKAGLFLEARVWRLLAGGALGKLRYRPRSSKTSSAV